MGTWELAGDISVRCDAITPEEVTALTRVEPTRVVMSGSVARPGAAPTKVTMWYLKGQLADIREPDAAVRALIAQLPPAVDFRVLGKRATAWVELVCYFGDQTPPLWFPMELLAMLANRGLSLDIDMIQTEMD
jgi:hypothetical protein